MEITSDSGKIQILLRNIEAPFLIQVFEELKNDYQVPPESMETKVAGVWYSNEGHLRVNSSEEEEREWNQELFEYRSHNVEKIEEWLRVLRNNENESILWEVPWHELDALLVVMNDHRLSLAARHEVAEVEMEHDLEKVADLQKRRALFQIHILGMIISRILELMNE